MTDTPNLADLLLREIRRKAAADTLRTVAEWGLVDPAALDEHVLLDGAVAETRAELLRLAERLQKEEP